MSDASRVPIVVSSGWMFASGCETFAEQEPVIREAGGAELSITSTERVEAYDVPLADELGYLSFHISPKMSPPLVKRAVKRHRPETVVVHPDAVSRETLAAYIEADIPLSIENMDVRKDSGYDVAELDAILRAFPRLGFTLDVQHAYEHDFSMAYAEKLVDTCGDRLVELHVSGETTDSIHALVSEAGNAPAILSFLESHYADGHDTPMVIEGEYETIEQVQAERDLLAGVVKE